MQINGKAFTTIAPFKFQIKTHDGWQDAGSNIMGKYIKQKYVQDIVNCLIEMGYIVRIVDYFDNVLVDQL